MKKTALVISIAVTALVLIAMGGIFKTVRANASAAVQTNEKAASNISNANLDPSIQQLLNDREQSYQDLIAQANQRIDQLQQENQQLRDQLDALQNNASAGQSAGLTPDQAAQLAANYLGETDLYSLESGTFNGVPVYKVTFSSGSIILVGADGRIVAQQIVSNNNSNSGTSRFFGESNEHEGRGGDD